MSVVQFLIHNPSHVLISILVGLLTLLTFHIFKFYANRKNYPPGPFPIPFVGNILLFRSQKKHIHHIFEDLAKKYGPVYTFYMGNDPQVIVADKDLSLEAMKKHQFAGRPAMPMMDEFFKEGSVDVIFGDFNTEWEVLRKVAHSALRKYAVSDTLPQVVSDVVDEIVENIRASDKKEVDIKYWLNRTLYAILLTSAFGQKYKLNDPDLLQWVENSKIQNELNTELILVGFIPWMKYVYWNSWKKLKKTIEYQWEFMERKYNEHLKTFDGVTIRDFTDAMLMAKKEAEEENSLDAIEYLKPWNIMNSIEDMFTAGSETSRTTLLWAFLLMAYYPQHQRRMRQEIEENISDDDIPRLEHRAKCHWTAAFIAETLRFRHIFPFNIPHKATVDVELGGHAIQQGTTVLPLLSPGLTDKEVWGDPDTFRPERFLDQNGKFISKPSTYYAPFSSGRRTCPGEKVALFDMFFIIARFLQKTKDEEFCLPNGSKSVDLYGDPDQTGGCFPYHFELILKPFSV